MKLPGWNSERFANALVATVLVVVPFHAFLTVWGSSLVGHYTMLRLWDDTLLLILFCVCCWWLVKDMSLRIWFGRSMLVRLIAAYVALLFLLGLVAYVKGEVTPKSLAYGLLVDLRFPVWFLAVLLTAQRSTWLRRLWPKIVLVPAAVVVVFAVLQFTVLPHNFLGHFGYNAATTIAPIETINHNSRYIRVQSTLRGANPLGAYLVVILSAIGVLFVRGRRKLLCMAFGMLAFAALYASGSRSAWIAAVLSLGALVWLQIRSRRGRLILGGIGVAVLVLAVGGWLVLQHNVGLQNEVLHTQAHSAIKTTSNGAHLTALKNGLKDVVRQPFGDGPGTAGPASYYNGRHPARIAENYYVQIAQEVGWLGLALFLSILTLVLLELYAQIGTSRLALVAFVSFIGIAFINMLSHAWVDDTLAYLWWGLAAIALAKQPKKGKGRIT